MDDETARPGSDKLLKMSSEGAELPSRRASAWDGNGSRDNKIDSSTSPTPLVGEVQSSLGTRVDERMLSGETGTAHSTDPSSGASGNAVSGNSPRASSATSTRTSYVENITLRPADEIRIEQAMMNADKKQSTGSVFSVRINIEKSRGVLGIGVKDLSNGILTVSMLKRKDSLPGPGESAGLRLGDVIFGINFLAARKGSASLLSAVQQLEANRAQALNSATEAAEGKNDKLPSPTQQSSEANRYIHLQCWRCHQLCIEEIPGGQFPRTDDAVVKAFAIYRNKIVSDWERWNFIDIILSYMLQDARERTLMTEQRGYSIMDRKVGHRLKDSHRDQIAQLHVMDLERNILLAKCIRKALCVRIVHTKLTKQQDTVVYVLRVEDVETGLEWVAHRRYRDFYALYEELAEMSGYVRDVEFPQKRLVSRGARVVESRMVSLEQYIRKVLHILSLYATMDPIASRSLRHVQKFLRVDKYIDCMFPPVVDDQRYIELMAYQFLNDFSSAACQQVVRFVNSVNLEALVEHGKPEGYRPALQHLSAALHEVEQFTLQQHNQQMHAELRARRPQMSPDQITTFVRRCVRRQVEAALFLPLRRTLVRIVFSFVAPEAQRMQNSLQTLSAASTQYFMVNSAAPRTKALLKAMHKFRDVTRAFLPADQGQLLMHAAAAVMEVHTECANIQRQKQQKSAAAAAAMIAKTVEAVSTAPATVISAVPVLAPSTDSPRDNFNTSETSGAAEVTCVEGEEESSDSDYGEDNLEKNANGTGDFPDDSGEGYRDGDGEEGKEGGDEHRIVAAVDSADGSIITQSDDIISGEWERTHGMGLFLGKGVSGIGLDGTGAASGLHPEENDDYRPGQPDSVSTKKNGTTPQRRWSVGVTASGSKELRRKQLEFNAPNQRSERAASPARETTTIASVFSEKLLTTSAASVQAETACESDRSDPSRETHGALSGEMSAAVARTEDGPSARTGAVEAASTPTQASDAHSSVDRGDSITSNRGNGSKYVYLYPNWLDPVVLADPIREIFESRETVPARYLLSDKSRPRPIPGVPFDLSFLFYGDDDGEAGSSMEDRSLPVGAPSFAAAGSGSICSTGDGSTPKVRGVKSSRAGTFSPSIEEVSPVGQIGLGPKVSLSPASIRGSAAAGPAPDRSLPNTNTQGHRMGSSFTPLEISNSVSVNAASASDAEQSQTTPAAPSRAVESGAANEHGGDALDGQGLQPDSMSEATNTSAYYDLQAQNAAVSADEFLPMFTYVLVQANLPHLLVVKEIMSILVDDEESYGECGYYLATLEAALKHIGDLAADFKRSRP
jgi:hypothetical protein